MTDYQRVAKAITFVKEHSTDQPKLDDIAKAVHLSPYHFHRMFKKWAGVTPKEFLQYISLKHAKKLLNRNQTIEKATFYTGLSSSSRLHDLFVNIEGMTPGEFKNQGQSLDIRYHFSNSPFGDILIASTGKGISNLNFVKERDESIRELKERWPKARITEGEDKHIRTLDNRLGSSWEDPDEIKLHLRGTEFQLKVWEALLKIPVGHLVTYSDVAQVIDNPNASRAVGTALANNPIAYLIPCHRVIRKVGDIGEYRWGSTRKTAIIGWEVAQASAGNHAQAD
ncbi:DNA-O6-methylguanine--protein-cysteine S-methyltransferase /Transcriptional regulator Ada [Fodinibius roseus]|uniref:methylated-DNA--[protein]-cysteine S-methyltransferase n=1 Tax=Fodinibius roseus TaxID=1194090 RepID=A0A1M5FLA6_9BACT|nr:methylated-DNA--[protein]-cysteine S-methyltransferase [Fodinibius roseus]SHF91932.1 DNA-O6-methylguanine--protein-cysteine S-methyltransferase /Transcriptional regulator Ada [Fodinibius roseus]